MSSKTNDDLDRMIDEALNAEERELLSVIGDEPGYFKQVFGLFGGPLGWITWLMMIIQSIMFIAAVWMAVHFFNAADTLEALHWGLPSAVLLIMSGMMKLITAWPSLQANRVIREVKRLELQLARGRQEN